MSLGCGTALPQLARPRLPGPMAAFVGGHMSVRGLSRFGRVDREEPTPAGASRRWNAKVLTVSDGVIAGTREDRSGAALVERLRSEGFDVVEHRAVADGRESVGEAIVELAEDFTGLIVTTGGTGFGPRDLTPEGTRVVLDREAPGLAEAMRLTHPLGRLSRATAGTRGQALILNTPGSASGAVECLEAVLDVIPHALALLAGERPH